MSIIPSQLIDEINALEAEIGRQSDELKTMKQDLVCVLRTEGLDKAFGTEGLGYQVSKTPTAYAYKPEALEYLSQKDLLHHFVGQPRITRSGLDKLQKEGLINYSDLAIIEDYTVATDGEYTVRKVVDKAFQAELLAPVTEAEIHAIRSVA